MDKFFPDIPEEKKKYMDEKMLQYQIDKQEKYISDAKDFWNDAKENHRGVFVATLVLIVVVCIMVYSAFLKTTGSDKGKILVLSIVMGLFSWACSHFCLF